VWPYCEFKMQVWNLLHAARWKHRMQKSRQKSPSGHHRTTLSGYIFATKARINNRKKNLLSSNMSSTCSHNMVNFGLLAAEISWPVWDTPPNFNGLRVLAALLHSSKVVSISQTLQRWTEGATYVWQGDHHVGHWPTFPVSYYIVTLFKLTVYKHRTCHVQNRWMSTENDVIFFDILHFFCSASSTNYLWAVFCCSFSY